MSRLIAKTSLSGFSQPMGGLDISEHAGGELVSLAFALGSEQSAAILFEKHFGHPPPTPNHWINIKGGQAMWTGQNQFLLILNKTNINIDKAIAHLFDSHAYATLQTDGWAALNVSGKRVHDVFDRFISLDLRRQPAGFAARSSAHHMSVIIVKFSEDNYRLLTPRTSAKSFLKALKGTAENALGY